MNRDVQFFFVSKLHSDKLSISENDDDDDDDKSSPQTLHRLQPM